MDSDVSTTNSEYFKILKDRREDLDFLMPQFYNGVTRPGLDGVAGQNVGNMAAITLYEMLANDLFDHEPSKVIFGFCISDCSGTGSNVNANQAIQVMSGLQEFNAGEFSCNGGAFFWVALHDTNGSWSKTVLGQVSTTAGCSNVSSSTSSTSSSVQQQPTNAPTTNRTQPLCSSLISKETCSANTQCWWGSVLGECRKKRNMGTKTSKRL
jgi:hypothetical protein